MCSHSSTGKPVAMFSHKRKSSREFHSNKDGEYAEQPEVRKLLEIQADRALQGEQEALSKLIGTEIHTTILLEEQRSQIFSKATFESLLQETRAEHAFSSLQNLQKTSFALKIRKYSGGSRNTNLHDRNAIYFEQNCKVERWRVHQEAHNRVSQEMEELKRAKNCGMDEFSCQKLRESEFTVTEHTAQIQ